MGGKTRVFAWKNAALIGDELLEQIDVLEVKRVKSEIDFRLRPRSPVFHRAALPARFVFIFVYFAWHKNYLISR